MGLLGTGAFQTLANQGREGMQRQGRSNQETLVQPWGRVLVLPQAIHITISLSSFTELTPPPNKWKMLAFFIAEKLIMRPYEARLKEQEKLIRRSPEARLKECRPCTHPDPYLQLHA